MNSATLRNSENTVERYLLRLRPKFFAASSPSKPNSFERGLTRTSRERIFTSSVWRMDSMGETASARRAGMRAEISVVSRQAAAATRMPEGAIESRI